MLHCTLSCFHLLEDQYEPPVSAYLSIFQDAPNCGNISYITRMAIIQSQLFLPFQSEKRNNFQKKPLSIMPLLLCKAIHNIKQNIVPQMNFSSNILLFLFHIFDPEIIRFRYSESKNSKSYSRSILLRTKRRKKKREKRKHPSN